MSENKDRLARLREQFGKTAQISEDAVREDEETEMLPFIFTYKRELERRGIERGGYRYRNWMTWAWQWIAQHRNFHRFILDPLTRRVTFRIPTIAVVAIDMRLELWVNPDFIALHSLRKTAGIGQHESIHIMSGHIPRALRLGTKKFHEDPLHALAMDCAVNSTIQDPKDLPDGCIHPALFKLPDPEKDKEHWSNFPERRTYEEYHEWLKQVQEGDPDQLDGMDNQFETYMIEVSVAGEGEGEGEGEDGEGGSGGDNKLPALRPDVKLDGRTLDDHSMWLVDSKMDADDVETIIKQHVRDARDRAKNAGCSPGIYQSLLDEMLKEKAIPWTRIFRAFWGRLMGYERQPSLLRPNRRTRKPPGSISAPDLHMILYLDVSGSMSDEEVELLLGECAHAANIGGAVVEVQQFESVLVGPLVRLQRYKKPPKDRFAHGGTCFAPVMRDIEERRPDVAFIGTDGWNHDSYEVPGNVPLGWVITSDGQEHDEGMTVRLPSKEEILKGIKAKVKR
jgi:predicted metal-dependent peptidase